MDWIGGKRLVQGDTSQGPDIYRWRFGPRATTLRNLDWYGKAGPRRNRFPGVVRSRMAERCSASASMTCGKVEGSRPADCWQRLVAILEWEKEVHSEGAIASTTRAASEARRSKVVYSRGTRHRQRVLREQPDPFHHRIRLPRSRSRPHRRTSHSAAVAARLPGDESERSPLPQRSLDVAVSSERIEITLKDSPADPLRIALDSPWRGDTVERTEGAFSLAMAGPACSSESSNHGCHKSDRRIAFSFVYVPTRVRSNVST